MGEEKKPDVVKPAVVLSDGREINFDLNAITVGEWRAFVDNITAEAEDVLIEKCADLEKGLVIGLGYGDWQKLTKAFYAQIREPLTNPN